MGLGNLVAETSTPQNKIKWLSIHHGKVELSENGVKQLYDFVEGRLSSIYTKERNYNGEPVLKWFINLRDEEGELYSISFPYSSGTFKSIVLALASATDLTASTIVKILPYQKGSFTNVAVYADGAKLDWVVKQLPPLDFVTINGQRVKDEAKRMKLISSFVDVINRRANNGNNGNTENKIIK